MYWIETLGQIKSANLDGSNVQTLLNLSPGRAGGIAVDTVNNELYFDVSVPHAGTAWTGAIYRSALDGSSIQQLATINLGLVSSSPRAIALDIAGGKMYWADATDYGHTGMISRANLDGTNVQTVISYSWPDDLALDLAHGKLYWSDFNSGRIMRSNLDGSAIQTVIASADTTYGFALDVDHGKIYYNYLVGANRVIASANLDGSLKSTLLTGFSDVRGMAVDVSTNKLYWLNAGAQSIQRSNLDGTGVETVVNSGLYYPIHIAVVNAVVPEPTSIVLFLVGTIGVFQVARPRRELM
jgi:DNA-binding beta-propeller fold protein YncE